MTTEISNSEDVIDSRDVIARIDELEGERGNLECDLDEAKSALDEHLNGDEQNDEREQTLQDAVDDAESALSDWDAVNGDELKALKALADEAEGYADDWKYGASLIRYDYFTEYAKQLCEDIGDLPRNIPSYIEIDWEKTADNIKVDYTSVDFDGVEYWVR